MRRALIWVGGACLLVVVVFSLVTHVAGAGCDSGECDLGVVSGAAAGAFSLVAYAGVAVIVEAWRRERRLRSRRPE